MERKGSSLYTESFYQEKYRTAIFRNAVALFIVYMIVYLPWGSSPLQCNRSDIVKYIVLLGDGMADHPLEACGGRTAIEAAHTPNMDRIAASGCSGLFCPVPEGMPPGSDVGNLSVFGYDPRTFFSGRAAIEAASQGITLGGDEVAFRCNLVCLEQGVMRDFTSGHITTEEARILVQSLNEAFTGRFPIVLHAGVSYRHTGVIKASAAGSVDQLAATECEPPHNITGKEYVPWLPKGPAAALLRELMEASEPVLREHPVNGKRVEAGNLPATSLWPWGQGRALALESYRDRFGLSGAVISAVDLVKGIGVCAGLDVVDVPGATGWIDTNYEGKVDAARKALEHGDFVYIHVEAPDEASHQGNVELKIRAIEQFDERIVGPFLEYQAAHPETRLLAAPDHFTLISTKTHAGGPVPFAMCGPGIERDEVASYSEKAAAASGTLVARGHELLHHFIHENPLSVNALHRA